MGRSKLDPGGPTSTVTFKIPTVILAQIDAAAETKGVSRSEVLRAMVISEAWLREFLARPPVPWHEIEAAARAKGVLVCEHVWKQQKSAAMGVVYVCDKCDARSLSKPG